MGIVKAQIGTIIKTMRESRAMRQKELADAIGKAPSAISNYENGTRVPDFDTLEAMADVFNVPMSAFVENDSQAPDTKAVFNISEIPVIGTIKCGPGGLALQEIEGTRMAANIKHPNEYFYFHVTGDSMEPYIFDGDYALVRRQPVVESGEIAAVCVNGDEGMLKKVKIAPTSITLISFNTKYDPMIFIKEEMNKVKIIGKVVKTEKDW